MTKASAASRVFQVPLARLFVAQGNLSRARKEAEVAVRYYRDRLKSDPTNIAERLAWADAVALLEDFPAAIEILKEGMPLANDPTIISMAIARHYVGWYDVRKKATGVPISELLALIDKGLSYDASNKDLLNRLIEQLRYGGPGAEQGRKVLVELLAKGGSTIGPIHFALAIDARTRGDKVNEQFHLERAYQLDPRTGLIANNSWRGSSPSRRPPIFREHWQ